MNIRMMRVMVLVMIAGMNTYTLAGEPPAGFERCAVCHTVTDTSTESGPDLYGVFGRAAGSREDFRYSRPLTRSGIVWDENTLDAFLRAPDELVPGTRMPFEGIESDAERAAIIEYLTTLK